MPPPAKSQYLAAKEAFRNVIQSAGQMYLTPGSGLLVFPQNGTSPENQGANFGKIAATAQVMRTTPEVYVEETIQLFEINCKSLAEFITNDCAGNVNMIEGTLRSQFGVGQIADMRVGESMPAGFNVGDMATATRLIDYLAGITALDLL